MGIEQVNQSIAQMDVNTRQNAALVEESMTATHGMEHQAGLLAEGVARFHLDDGQTSVLQRIRQIASAN